MLTLSPSAMDGQLFNPVSLLFLATSMLPRLCNESRPTQPIVAMLMLMALGAARPRMLMLLDNRHEMVPLKANARVGQAVDTTGQAGNVRNISGFQTLEVPVLLAPGERAVLVDEEKYELGTHLLDGFVFAEEKWVVC